MSHPHTADASGFLASLTVAQSSPPEGSAAQWQERAESLQERVDGLQEILAKPLSEILADREKSQEAAAAWDSFGAMWMLSQRAMRRVALDLATAQGISEAEVVARALRYANEVLNGDDENLGGTIAQAQMAHIARHKPFLRKQFK